MQREEIGKPSNCKACHANIENGLLNNRDIKRQMKELLLILILATFLYASDSKKEHHLSKDLSYLDLTSQQKESAKNIIKQYRVELKAFREFKENGRSKRACNDA